MTPRERAQLAAVWEHIETDGIPRRWHPIRDRHLAAIPAEPTASPTDGRMLCRTITAQGKRIVELESENAALRARLENATRALTAGEYDLVWSALNNAAGTVNLGAAIAKADEIRSKNP